MPEAGVRRGPAPPQLFCRGVVTVALRRSDGDRSVFPARLGACRGCTHGHGIARVPRELAPTSTNGDSGLMAGRRWSRLPSPRCSLQVACSRRSALPYRWITRGMVWSPWRRRPSQLASLAWYLGRVHHQHGVPSRRFRNSSATTCWCSQPSPAAVVAPLPRVATSRPHGDSARAGLWHIDVQRVAGGSCLDAGVERLEYG